MAANEPAKAPPLYEPGAAIVNRWRTTLGERAAGCRMVDATHDPHPARSRRSSLVVLRHAFRARRSARSPFGEKGDLVDFSYAWSAEASAIPALDAALARATSTQQWKRRARRRAQADRAERARRQARPSTAISFSRRWTHRRPVARACCRSKARTSIFTGGAHPNHGSTRLAVGPPQRRARSRSPRCSAIRRRSRRCSTSDFAPRSTSSGPSARRADRARRAVRRLPETERSDARPRRHATPMRRFDRLRVVADPYVAGPYAEGFYRIDRAGHRSASSPR